MTHEIDGYEYIGDINLAEGGRYIGTRGRAAGHVIEIISASDWDGPCTVISREITTVAPSAVRRAIGACGWRVRGRAAVLEALCAYGYCDPANEYPRYHEVEIADDADESEIIAAVESYAR